MPVLDSWYRAEGWRGIGIVQTQSGDQMSANSTAPVLQILLRYWGDTKPVVNFHLGCCQANMVVVKRCELNFWRKSLEESMQCKLVHYPDAKTMSCMPKISFKTVLTDPFEMPRVLARSLIINRLFLSAKSLIFMTFFHHLMFFLVRGALCLQRVLCLLWKFYATRISLFSIEPGHRMPSAISSTCLQSKFHSAYKI